MSPKTVWYQHRLSRLESQLGRAIREYYNNVETKNKAIQIMKLLKKKNHAQHLYATSCYIDERNKSFVRKLVRMAQYKGIV